MKLTTQDLNSILIVKNKLINGLVEDIKIGYSTTLIISNEGNYYKICIGNSEVRVLNESHRIDVYDINSKLCLAKLFKNNITFLDIDDNGSLTIIFDNTNKIITKAGLDYEAWELNGPDGFQIVCMPGGTLAFWMNK